MSRIEELPDDFDESLDLNNPPPNLASLDEMYDQRGGQNASNTATPAIPSFEETMKEFSKTPLFMDGLDVAGDAAEENDALAAIRALQYEGTRAEIATNFKEQGNETVRAKLWADAREFYTKGIAVLTDKTERRWETGENPVAEAEKEKSLLEMLYANRALCQLELKNYRSTTLDCAAALRINPNNMKAHYRSASALFALDRLPEAIDVCQRGLKLDSSNVALKKLSAQIAARNKIKEELELKAKAERKRKEKERVVLNAALRARNIRLRGSEKPPDLEDAAIRLSPDPLSPKSLLEFPTLFLYPMHNQSDFVKAFAEKDAIIDHLSYMIPLPWDTKKEYTVESVDCYMDTTSGGMMKVGKKLSLLQALTSGKTEVVDGMVRIHVVPSLLAPKWIEEVKKKKDKSTA